MCGRFTLTDDNRDGIAEQLAVSADELKDYKPRFNIAPTQTHFVVRMEHEDREVLWVRWGLIPSWSKDAKGGYRTINARADGVEKKPAYRSAFKRRRCIVPADGFYEWEGPKDDRRPSWFHRGDGGLLMFAGLYEFWTPKDDDEAEPLCSFTIITTDANEFMSQIHDRMPVILPEENIDDWIDPGETDVERLKELLVPAGEDVLIRRRVSKDVNSVKNHGAGLIEEIV